jgi:hypothetical protein
MASRIELPGCEHLICDAARSKSTLHQAGHLFLGHRGRSSSAKQLTRTLSGKANITKASRGSPCAGQLRPPQMRMI